jgi:hypothetical protein
MGVNSPIPVAAGDWSVFAVPWTETELVDVPA